MTIDTIDSAVKFLRSLPENMEGFDKDGALVVFRPNILADHITGIMANPNELKKLTKRERR